MSSSTAWADLSAGGTPTRGEFRVYTTDVLAAEGPTLLALDGNGLRHVLIPIRAGAHVELDQRSSGVHITKRELVDNGTTSTFVDVACRKPHLSEVFGYLAEEVLVSIQTEPGKPATVARRVLNRWRELIERDRPGVLAEEGLIGLFGELWVLHRLCQQTPAAVERWVGPLGARFDFQQSATALEIKTAVKGDSVRVHIHGVDQLDPPGDVELYLGAIVVERTPGSGYTVPALVADIRKSGVDSLALSAKLRSIGYADEDREHYLGLELTVRDERFYRVDDSFPRIVRGSFSKGDLPPRVTTLRYTVDLTSTPPEPLEASEIQGLMTRLSTA